MSRSGTTHDPAGSGASRPFLTVAVLLGFAVVLLWPSVRMPLTDGASDATVYFRPVEPGPAAPAQLAGIFPIGVFVPPAAEFTKWKERGVNTVFEVPQGHDLERWTAEANRQGLRMIRAPRADPERDRHEPLLLAWSQPDEPDLHGIPAADLVARYRQWKAADPRRPVVVNLSGGHVLGLQGSCPAACYESFSATADWISSDIYPVTGWNRSEKLGWIGETLSELRRLSGGRPQFAFIETSDQNLSSTPAENPGVTARQLRAEVWNAIIFGARGIWYFPVSFGPFRFDATPMEVVDELTRQNARITSLASVLLDEINPSSMGVRVQNPLQVTWRLTSKGAHVIVLNLSDFPLRDQLIAVDGTASRWAVVHGEDRGVPISAGVIRDDFEPYGVHVYEIANAPTTNGTTPP